MLINLESHDEQPLERSGSISLDILFQWGVVFCWKFEFYDRKSQIQWQMLLVS